MSSTTLHGALRWIVGFRKGSGCRYTRVSPLFEKYTAGRRQLLNVQQVKIIDFDGTEGLPILSWCGDPIEILYVDCGRTYAVNDAWYNHLKSSFIRGRTLIVIQDWRTHREVPAQVVQSNPGLY